MIYSYKKDETGGPIHPWLLLLKILNPWQKIYQMNYNYSTYNYVILKHNQNPIYDT